MINEALITDLFKKDSNIILVAAYGSYPRNEAAYIPDDYGKPFLFNDFDLVIVVKDSKLFSKKVLEYKSRLSDIIGGCEIDFLIMDKPITAKSKSTIWFKDFQECSRIFLGRDSDMEYYFGTSNNYNISVFDVYSLFITRSWTAGCLSPVLIDEPFNKIYKGYQAAKLIIATVDLFLLSHSQYKTFLKDKMLALESIDSNFSRTLTKNLILAIKIKRSPLKEDLCIKIQKSEYCINLINDYNYAFNIYSKSKSFFPDYIIKIYMKLRYFRCLISQGHGPVSARLSLRHKMASLLLKYKKDQDIRKLNQKMAIALTSHENIKHM